MKRGYRIFVIILAVILGGVTQVLLMNTSVAKIARNSSVTEEEFAYLTECASEVAKTLDEHVIEDEKVTVHVDVRKDFLIITVRLIHSNFVKCRVVARYPISFDKEYTVEDAMLQHKGSIDYDNVIYTEYRDIQPYGFYIGTSMFLGIIIGGSTYFFLYWCVQDYKKRFGKK